MAAECVEKCGIAAVIAPEGINAAPVAAKVASELQHRGQEGGGLGTKEKWGEFRVKKRCGRFGQIFSSPADLEGLTGEIAIGHTRYRTTGAVDNACFSQPMLVSEGGRTLLGGHNGNIANANELIEDLQGSKLDTDIEGYPTSDSEVLFRRIAKASGGNWPEKIRNGLIGVEGAFSLVIATDENELIALRDPWGIRPLSFGRINGHFIVSSETCALDMVGARKHTEIGKGEMYVFRSGQEPEKIVYDDSKSSKYCDFEDWYFSHPTSARRGLSIDRIRERCGEMLAKEEIADRAVPGVDLVVCVPDTSKNGVITYAEGIGVNYRERIIKERYGDPSARSFIGSSEALRKQTIDNKYFFSPDLEGKRIIVVDDTGVRLLTTGVLTRVLKESCDVKEVHLRFLAPKFVRPCVLGVNINRRSELGVVEFVNGQWKVKSDEQIAHELGADSVRFLSMEGRRSVREYFGERAEDFCGYCHGDSGPFDFLKYDPDQVLENYDLACAHSLGV